MRRTYITLTLISKCNCPKEGRFSTRNIRTPKRVKIMNSIVEWHMYPKIYLMQQRCDAEMVTFLLHCGAISRWRHVVCTSGFSFSPLENQSFLFQKTRCQSEIKARYLIFRQLIRFCMTMCGRLQVYFEGAMSVSNWVTWGGMIDVVFQVFSLSDLKLRISLGQWIK
jgi:hypothetical protein